MYLCERDRGEELTVKKTKNNNKHTHTHLEGLRESKD